MYFRGRFKKVHSKTARALCTCILLTHAKQHIPNPNRPLYMPAVTLALLLLFTSSSSAAAFGLAATAASTRINNYSRRLLATTMASAYKKPQVTFVTGNAKKLEVRLLAYGKTFNNGVGRMRSRVADEGGGSRLTS